MAADAEVSRRFRAATVRLAVILLANQTALAQPAAPTAGDTLEEITVTARKRVENLQDTPIAVTAFSAEALEAHQVASITEIGRFVPNVSFESSSNIAGSSNSATFFIRGVGQTDFNLTIDPGVGLYVDGVYVSRSVGALLDTVDLERVEVLRGPQGTLFGKNTIGGAVVLTSKQPAKELGGSLDAATGTDNRFDMRGSLNVPVNDKLALRLTGSAQTRAGYVDRLADGGEMGNKHSVSGRFLARLEATDSLAFNWSVDGTRSREHGIPSVLLAVNPTSGFASFWNFALNGATCFTPPTGLPVPDHPQCFNGQWITGDPYKTWAGGDNYSNLDLWGTALTAEWRPGALEVKSISSYRHMSSSFALDTDAAPQPISQTQNDYSQKQWSEELQLSGSALQSRLHWLVGLYYLNEKGTDRNNLTFAIADFLSGGIVDNDSFATFGQLTFAVMDRVDITFGGRYTDETKRFLPDQYIKTDRTGGSLLELSRCFINPVPVLPPSPACTANPALNPDGNRILPFIEATAKAKEFTPSVTLDFKPSEHVLTYASYSKGFKSGGFTQRVFPPEPAVSPFNPEFVKSYEIGAKSELFERRVRWNSALFYTDYADMQLIVNEGIAPKVRNAGKASIRGIETELEIVASDRVRFTGGAGYTDAHYDSLSANVAPVTLDSKLPNAPKWTATAAIAADAWSGNAGKLSLNADWSYKGEHFKDAVNSPQLRQGGYGLLGANVTFAPLHGGWSLSLGGANLTNKAYLLSGYQDLANIGAVTGAFGRPREWYLRGRLEFAGRQP